MAYHWCKDVTSLSHEGDAEEVAHLLQEHAFPCQVLQGNWGVMNHETMKMGDAPNSSTAFYECADGW